MLNYNCKIISSSAQNSAKHVFAFLLYIAYWPTHSVSRALTIYSIFFEFASTGEKSRPVPERVAIFLNYISHTTTLTARVPGLLDGSSITHMPHAHSQTQDPQLCTHRVF